MSIGTWPERWSQLDPTRVALVDGVSGERVSYTLLHRRALAWARWLRDVRGVGPGDRVAWVAQNHPAFFDVLFACARLGAILVPVNWRLAPPEIAWILEHAAPSVVLDEACVAALHAGPDAATEPTSDGDTRAVSDAADVPCRRADDATPLMILYTSGTTGRPKGAVLTHGQVIANSLHTQIACDLRADDVTVTYTPLFHTGAVHVLSMPLLHRGGKVVLLRCFDATEVLAAVERERVTILFGVPTTFEMLEEAPSFASTDLSSVRFALCGGAPCPLPLIERYGARGVVFRQGFGMTEVGPNCFSLPPADAARKAGTVGFPVIGSDARIVDAEGHEVAAGEVGELWLRGPHVCGGYWQDPAATAAARRPDGFWATGDLFRVDAEGYYQVVGRKKEMFISGGENVYPAEVEQAIITCPGVRECAVIGVPCARWGEVGRAFVAPASVDPVAVLAHLQDRLARYKIPKSVVPLPALPKNATGKIARATLAKAAHLDLLVGV